MKCNVSKKDLTRLLTRCKGAADPKGEDLNTQCVLLRAEGQTLSAFATNLKLNMYTETQCAVEAEGAAAIHIEKLRNAVSAMPDGFIQLKTDSAKHATTVSCTGHRKYTIHGLNPAHFPQRELPPKLEWYNLPLKLVQEAIVRTKASAATDDGRPGMVGLMFEFAPTLFQVISTNGYTFQYFEHKDDFKNPDGACFLPLPAVAMMASSTDDLSIAYSDRAVFVNTGVDRLSALLPAAGFPNWKFIRDKAPRQVMCKFDVPQLIAGVRGVTAVTKGPIEFKLENSTIHLKLVNVPDSESEDALPVNADASAAFRVVIQPEHILGVLEGAGPGIAEFIHDITDPLAPIVINGDDGYFGLVQPVAK